MTGKTKKTFSALFSLFSAVLFATFFFNGCGAFNNIKKSTQKIIPEFTSPDGDLKKKVAIAGLKNLVLSAKQDIGAAIDKSYHEVVSSSCSNIEFMKPGDPGFPDNLAQIPQTLSGKPDNIAIVQIGKKLGLSAVVSTQFLPVTVRKEDRGFFWFRKKQQIVWVNASLEIYDIETGAKFLDQAFTQQFKINETEAEEISKGNVSSVPAVEKAALKIIADIGKAVCKSVASQPWKGYIREVSKDALTFSAGSLSGLSTGRILHVYSSGTIIRGTEGQTYQMIGKKAGEIRVTSVFSDRVEAVGISGGGFQVGDVVKTK